MADLITKKTPELTESVVKQKSAEELVQASPGSATDGRLVLAAGIACRRRAQLFCSRKL
ncbi:hypothetical protein [Streptomyces sp. NBC_00057]|uniref:hypothetical protein n=1 Tax=Streptomyces sp. NBC_00057 TaxID=2975634 RepID=UPI003252DD6E